MPRFKVDDIVVLTFVVGMIVVVPICVTLIAIFG